MSGPPPRPQQRRQIMSMQLTQNEREALNEQFMHESSNTQEFARQRPTTNAAGFAPVDNSRRATLGAPVAAGRSAAGAVPTPMTAPLPNMRASYAAQPSPAMTAAPAAGAKKLPVGAQPMPGMGIAPQPGNRTAAAGAVGGAAGGYGTQPLQPQAYGQQQLPPAAMPPSHDAWNSTPPPMVPSRDAAAAPPRAGQPPIALPGVATRGDPRTQSAPAIAAGGGGRGAPSAFGAPPPSLGPRAASNLDTRPPPALAGSGGGAAVPSPAVGARAARPTDGPGRNPLSSTLPANLSSALLPSAVSDGSLALYGAPPPFNQALASRAPGVTEMNPAAVPTPGDGGGGARRASTLSNVPASTPAPAAASNNSGLISLFIKVPHIGFITQQKIETYCQVGMLQQRVFSALPPVQELVGDYDTFVNSEQSTPIDLAQLISDVCRNEDTIIFAKRVAAIDPQLMFDRMASTRFRSRAKDEASSAASAATTTTTTTASPTTPSGALPPPLTSASSNAKLNLPPPITVKPNAVAAADDDDPWSSFDAPVSKIDDDVDLNALDFDVDKMLADAGVTSMMADLDAGAAADAKPFWSNDEPQESFDDDAGLDTHAVDLPPPVETTPAWATPKAINGRLQMPPPPTFGTMQLPALNTNTTYYNATGTGTTALPPPMRTTTIPPPSSSIALPQNRTNTAATNRTDSPPTTGGMKLPPPIAATPTTAATRAGAPPAAATPPPLAAAAASPTARATPMPTAALAASSPVSTNLMRTRSNTPTALTSVPPPAIAARASQQPAVATSQASKQAGAPMLARGATPPALSPVAAATTSSSPLASVAAKPPPQLQQQPSPKVLITYDADGFPSNLPADVIEWALAAFDYKANSFSELSLVAGELVALTEKDPDGWWRGYTIATLEAGEPSRYFPSSFIDMASIYIPNGY